MCWSGEASAAIAIAGLSSAYLLKKKGQPKEIYLPPAYFVLMEGLQAVTYLVVDECGNSWNPVFTYLAMAHISFQPFFINMLGMEFVDPKVKARIKSGVYLLCAVAAAACLVRMLPAWDVLPGTILNTDLFGELGRCELNTPMCSHEMTCAYTGQWHIGWNVLLNGFNENWVWYLAAAFVLPVLYGSWKWSAYHYLVGPFLAGLTTTDINERPAVWCLFSTCIIALLVNTRVRDYIYVKSWPTWAWLGKPREKRRSRARSS